MFSTVANSTHYGARLFVWAIVKRRLTRLKEFAPFVLPRACRDSPRGCPCFGSDRDTVRRFDKLIVLSLTEAQAHRPDGSTLLTVPEQGRRERAKETLSLHFRNAKNHSPHSSF